MTSEFKYFNINQTKFEPIIDEIDGGSEIRSEDVDMQSINSDYES